MNLSIALDETPWASGVLLGRAEAPLAADVVNAAALIRREKRVRWSVFISFLLWSVRVVGPIVLVRVILENIYTLDEGSPIVMSLFPDAGFRT